MQLLDEEGAGEISATQMCAGFRRLGQALGIRMHISLEDCLLLAEQASESAFTDGGCAGNRSLGRSDGDGAAAVTVVASTVDAGRFAGIMRRALQQQVEKAIGRAMGACSPAGYERTLLAATRALMLSCASVDVFPSPAAPFAPEVPRDSGLQPLPTATGGSELPQGEAHLSPLVSQSNVYNADDSSDSAVDTGRFDLAAQSVRQETLSETICRLREEVAAAAARLALVSHELHVAANWELPTALPAPLTSYYAGPSSFSYSDARQSTAQEQHAEDASANNVSGADHEPSAASALQGILLVQKSTGESNSQSFKIEHEKCNAISSSRNCIDQLETAIVCCSGFMVPSTANDWVVDSDDTGGPQTFNSTAVLQSARSTSLKFHTSEASSYGLETQLVSTFRDGGEGSHANTGNCKGASNNAVCDSSAKIYAESVPEFSAAKLRWSLVFGMDWKSVWPGLWEGAKHNG